MSDSITLRMQNAVNIWSVIGGTPEELERFIKVFRFTEQERAEFEERIKCLNLEEFE